MKLSVVICTHNPRGDYLNRALDALKKQTYAVDHWELVVIDNDSTPPLAESIDLSWHPNSRIIVENELGILPARLRGMKEATSPLILFVDDDNVLQPDYLVKGIEIGLTKSFLGCWGGEIIPEFESPPPPSIDQFLVILACFTIDRDRWSNLGYSGIPIPPTAGLFVRRLVLEAFIETVSNDKRRQLLGRRGKTGLTNGEDMDLVLTSTDIGLGVGQFKRLHLTHLISKERLSMQYLIKLTEGSYYCGYLLDFFRGKSVDAPNVSPIRELLGKIRRRLTWNKPRRMFFEAQSRARKRAYQTMLELNKNLNSN